MENQEKKHSNLQSIFFRDQFVISKRNTNQDGEITTVISPFKKIGENLEKEVIYTSNLIFPGNLLNRILNVREHIKNIFTYSIQTDDMINVNCLNEIPTEIFQNFDRGVVQFTYKSFINDKRELITEIDDKGCWNFSNEQKSITYQQKEEIKFKTETLKVFPILLNKGFIFSAVTPNNVSMYLTVINTEKMYVGLLADSFQLNNLIKNIFPIFPSLFTITITDKNTANVFLKNITEIKNLIKEKQKEVILKFSYPLRKYQTIKCEIYATA